MNTVLQQTTVTRYECEFCHRIFDDAEACQEHEKYCGSKDDVISVIAKLWLNGTFSVKVQKARAYICEPRLQVHGVTDIGNVIAEFCVNSVSPDKFDLACTLIQDGVRDLKLNIDRNRGAVLDALLKAEFDKTNDRSM